MASLLLGDAIGQVRTFLLIDVSNVGLMATR